MITFMQDTRFALRVLRKSPGFTIVLGGNILRVMEAVERLRAVDDAG